jgi:hypothetical protein
MWEKGGTVLLVYFSGGSPRSTCVLWTTDGEIRSFRIRSRRRQVTMVNDRLSEEETAALDAAFLARGHQRYGRMTWTYVLNKWRGLVEDAELPQGYPHEIFEWGHDLYYRDLLSDVCNTVEAPLNRKTMEILAPLDARFERATKRVDEPILPPLPGEILGEWWYRVPKRLSRIAGSGNKWAEYYTTQDGLFD